MAAVDLQAVACAATGTGQAAGVEQAEELEVAGVLVEQVGDREVHEWGSGNRTRSQNLIIS